MSLGSVGYVKHWKASDSVSVVVDLYISFVDRDEDAELSLERYCIASSLHDLSTRYGQTTEARLLSVGYE